MNRTMAFMEKYIMLITQKKISAFFQYGRTTYAIKELVFLNVFVVFFFVSTKLSSQNIDSLKQILITTKADTTKVKVLSKLSVLFGHIDPKDRMQYAKTALSVANKINYKRGVVMAELGLAACLNDEGKYNDALNYINNALQITKQLPMDKETMAHIYGELGNNFYCLSEFKAALANYLKSDLLYEELGNKRMVGKLDYSISSVYLMIKEIPKAEIYAIKADEIFKLLGDSLMIALIETELGSIEEKRNEYKKALLYYQSAKNYSKNINDKSYSLGALIGIADVYSLLGKSYLAEVNYKKALEIAREVNDPMMIRACLNNFGITCSDLKQYDKAIQLLNESVILSKEAGAKDDLAQSYSFLSEVYEKRKDYKKAFEYKSLYIKLKDSIINEENLKQINDLSAKYEKEKKEKEILLLNSQVTSSNSERELLSVKIKEKNTLIILIGITTILTMALILLFFNREKLKNKSKFQNQLLEHQKTLANAVLQVQESERNRIAKELHDGVGTYLSTLKINLQASQSSVPTEKRHLYDSTMELIDQISGELRSITKNLSNEVLQENGLSNAINDLVERINRSGLVHFNLVIHGFNKRIDNNIEVNLYRIAQELINNCIKHSKASKITMQLIDHEDSIVLMLEDNGVGFDYGNLKNGAGMGLRNIHNRVEFLGGNFKVESKLEKGSTFIIEIPIT